MCESAPDLWAEAVLAVSCAPPAGPERPCSEAYVRTHSEVPSLCTSYTVIHSSVFMVTDLNLEVLVLGCVAGDGDTVLEG
jgi:hypothetical protein